MVFVSSICMPAKADPETSFATRCASPGVVWCIGFDSQQEISQVGQTRYAGISGSEAIINNPQAYPNNIGPGDRRYPAFDASEAASGSGSLRVTANPISSSNQSGGWYLGSAGISPWPETFGANETVYIQWRQRYDFAYTNEVDWDRAGGAGNKQIVIWDDGGSCSDMELAVEDSFNRGYPQAYTNCGGRPLYQCPDGAGNSNCDRTNTDYAPKAGHDNFLYQYGPEQRDFHCMRNAESTAGCGYFRNHHDRWWTYYAEISLGNGRSNSSHVKIWLSRGNGEPMRQFIDYGPFSWDYENGDEIANLLLTSYKTDKSSGNHAPATSWYDELIVSSEPIELPEGLEWAANAGECTGNGSSSVIPCPPVLAD